MKTWGYMQCRNWNHVFSAEKLLLIAKAQSCCTLPGEPWISGSKEVPWLKTSPCCWTAHTKQWLQNAALGEESTESTNQETQGSLLPLACFSFPLIKLGYFPLSISQKFHRCSNQVSVWSICMKLLRLASLVAQEDQLNSLTLKKKSVSEYKYI